MFLVLALFPVQSFLGDLVALDGVGRVFRGVHDQPYRIEADNAKFESALGRLIAIGESYPDLKASEVYQTTMGNIDKYEMALKNSRMIYNDTVTRYNREIKVFPAVIIAGFLGFREEEYADALGDERGHFYRTQ